MVLCSKVARWLHATCLLSPDSRSVLIAHFSTNTRRLLQEPSCRKQRELSPQHRFLQCTLTTASTLDVAAFLPGHWAETPPRTLTKPSLHSFTSTFRRFSFCHIVCVSSSPLQGQIPPAGVWSCSRFLPIIPGGLFSGALRQL